MRKYQRELRQAFPGHDIVKLRGNHYGIYDRAGCLVTVVACSPSDRRSLANAQHQARRHVCPALAAAPAAALTSAI